MQNTSKLPVGIKIIIGFHLLNILLWTIGQGGAVISYDTVAKWGLQDPRELIDPIIVEVNKGIGLADMIIMMPLFIIAVIGLWRKKLYGAITSWMVLGLSLYWPVVFWCSQFFYARADLKHQTAPASTHVILIFIVTFSLWASWYLFRYYKKNV